MSLFRPLFQASKAAVLRFYETLRAELGSEVGVTILTHGYVESEMTMGKAVQKDGVLVVDQEARDVSCQLSLERIVNYSSHRSPL